MCAWYDNIYDVPIWHHFSIISISIPCFLYLPPFYTTYKKPFLHITGCPWQVRCTKNDKCTSTNIWEAIPQSNSRHTTVQSLTDTYDTFVHQSTCSIQLLIVMIRWYYHYNNSHTYAQKCTTTRHPSNRRLIKSCLLPWHHYSIWNSNSRLNYFQQLLKHKLFPRLHCLRTTNLIIIIISRIRFSKVFVTEE